MEYAEVRDGEVERWANARRFLPAELRDAEDHELVAAGWYPVVDEHPEGTHDERIERLTGPTVTLGETHLLRRWEIAARPLDEVRAELLRTVKLGARSALAASDWYVMRQVETGDPIPADITARRAAIRTRSAVIEEKISKASRGEIRAYLRDPAALVADPGVAAILT